MKMILHHGDVDIDASVFRTAEDCMFGVAELEAHLLEAPEFYGSLVSSLSKAAAVRMTEPSTALASITVEEFEKCTDLIPPTGLAGNEAPVKRLLSIARKGFAAQQFGTARIFKALAIAHAGHIKKALAPVFVERERAAKAVVIAKRQRLLAQHHANLAARDPDLIRERNALAKTEKEAQIAEKLQKVMDYLSKGVDKAQANLADIDRRICHLEHQSFERHVAAQPSMRIQ